MSRPYIGPSDAQANADALERRGRTYAPDNAASFALSWDAGKRAPRDLRHAVSLVRRAYEDEVPRKMTEGPDSIGPDGTPKMTSQTEGYIFGSPTRTDAGFAKCDCPDYWKDAPIAFGLHTEECPADPAARPLIAYFISPFRATLDVMEHGPEPDAKRAAIVRHVSERSQGPKEAAIAEGVPWWCAGLVAFDALSAFLRQLSDIRVDVPRESAA